MAENLVLDSLEIRNFRAFRHLQIQRLGRVNLITGKNNVGKTSLLEALLLYARGGSPALIRDLLESRDELRAGAENLAPRQRSVYWPSQVENIRYLFHDYPDLWGKVESVSIGHMPIQNDNLSLSVQWQINHYDTQGQLQSRFVSPPVNEFTDADEAVPYLVAEQYGRFLSRMSLINVFDGTFPFTREPRELPVQYVKSDGLNPYLIGELWDKIALSSSEEDVLALLQLIDSRVKRVSIVGEERTQGRVPVVSLIGTEGRFPLKSLGDGINRLFGIALALVNAKGGLLLLDEIENGIHYSVQPQIWNFLFEAARRLNVQVFATTHSWDCIAAFQRAAQEHEEDEGVLIRLQNRNGEVVETLLDENELEIAVQENIEVRG